MVKNQSDFDPNELIKASAEHEKSLADLTAIIRRLEKRVGTDTALASSFKSAFENDKKMDKVLTDLLCTLVLRNDDFQTALQAAVAKVDRRWWNGAIRKALTAVGAVFLVVLGAFLQAQFGG